MTDLHANQVIADLLDGYEGIVATKAWGETSLFYNPGHVLPRGTYFATVKEKDGDNDRASHLDRNAIFRLNVGTSKPLYQERFGQPPPRPGKGGNVEGPWDFTGLNELTPHPVYGWMSWVAILNPSRETLNDIRCLIDAAHEKAAASFRKRVF